MRQIFLTIFVLMFFISSCTLNAQTQEPTASITPTKTRTPTITPTHTITPTLTLTPTSTITPTPSPTPLAGLGKVRAYCHGKLWVDFDSNGRQITNSVITEYDIASESYTVIYRPIDDDPWSSEYNKDYFIKALYSLGISDSQLAAFSNVTPQGNIITASKDGTKLLVMVYNENNKTRTLYLFNSNGSTQVFDVVIVGDIQQQQASRNQDLLAINVSILVDGEKQLSEIIINLEEGTIVNVGSRDSGTWGVRFSPDDKKVTYSTNDGVWVASITGETKDLIILGGENADWSPDGKELVFTKNRKLFISAIDGSNIKEVESRNNNSASSPEWVRIQGRREIIYWTGANQWEIVDLNNSSTYSLNNKADFTVIGSFWRTLNWSPDGHWFLSWYFSNQNGSYSYLCNVDSRTCNEIDYNGSEKSMCNYTQWPGLVNSNR